MPGLGDRLAVLQAGIRLRRLNAIDDVWTSYLAGATAAEVEEELEQVVELGELLLASIREATDSIGLLLDILRATDEDDIDRAFEEVIQSDPRVGEFSRDVLSELLVEYGPHEVVTTACQYLADRLPDEARVVEEKLERLRAGEFQPGDLGPRAKCALHAAILGAGLLDVALTGGTVGVIALEVSKDLFGFARRWRGGCRKVAREIWERFSG